MSGDMSLASLYISKATACVLWCTETELSLQKVLQISSISRNYIIDHSETTFMKSINFII